MVCGCGEGQRAVGGTVSFVILQGCYAIRGRGGFAGCARSLGPSGVDTVPERSEWDAEYSCGVEAGEPQGVVLRKGENVVPERKVK